MNVLGLVDGVTGQKVYARAENITNDSAISGDSVRDVLNVLEPSSQLTDDDIAKIGFITVTASVNLDDMASSIDSLENIWTRSGTTVSLVNAEDLVDIDGSMKITSASASDEALTLTDGTSNFNFAFDYTYGSTASNTLTICPDTPLTNGGASQLVFGDLYNGNRINIVKGDSSTSAFNIISADSRIGFLRMTAGEVIEVGTDNNREFNIVTDDVIRTEWDRDSYKINHGSQSALWSEGSDSIFNVRVNGNSAISILANATGTSTLNFGDTDDADINKIVVDHSDDSMTLVVNTADAMTIDSDGTVTAEAVYQTVSNYAPNDDLDDLTGNRYFRTHTSTLNSPVSSYGMGMNMEWGTSQMLQLCASRNSGLYRRNESNGSFGSWYRIWDASDFDQDDINGFLASTEKWNTTSIPFTETGVENAFFNTTQFPDDSPYEQNSTLFPADTFYAGVNVAYSATNGWQMVASRSNNSPLAYRQNNSEVWSDWKYIWDSNNVPEENINFLDDLEAIAVVNSGTVEIDGSIQIADDADTADATKVGTMRYRSDANNSYCDMCMQTGASTYAWVNIKQNTW